MESLVSGGTEGSVFCSSRKAWRRVCTRLRSRAALAAAGRPGPVPARCPTAGGRQGLLPAAGGGSDSGSGLRVSLRASGKCLQSMGGFPSREWPEAVALIQAELPSFLGSSWLPCLAELCAALGQQQRHLSTSSPHASLGNWSFTSAGDEVLGLRKVSNNSPAEIRAFIGSNFSSAPLAFTECTQHRGTT